MFLLVCIQAEVHPTRFPSLNAKIILSPGCIHSVSLPQRLHIQKSFPSRFKFYLPILLKTRGKWRNCCQIGLLQNHRKAQNGPPLKLRGSWQSETTVFGGHFLKARWKYPAFSPSPSTSVCICPLCVSVCMWLSRGFIRLQ